MTLFRSRTCFYLLRRDLRERGLDGEKNVRDFGGGEETAGCFRLVRISGACGCHFIGIRSLDGQLTIPLRTRLVLALPP